MARRASMASSAAGSFISLRTGTDARRWYWRETESLAIDAYYAPTVEAAVDRAERAPAVWKVKDAAR
jgi:hypothetical protein